MNRENQSDEILADVLKTARALLSNQGACYIEVMGERVIWSVKLTRWDRWRIGEFTRGNVADWLANYFFKHHPLDPIRWPVDFHAVCGDIDIPWTTKEAAECYAAKDAGKGYDLKRTSWPPLWE
jgi:hypothetical protein